MGHYIANLRDLEFNLFEVLNIGTVLGSGRYRDLDVDTVHMMLEEVARLAEGPIADSFADADRNPPVFEPDRHTISVPAELAKSVQAVKDAEWWRIGLAEEIGGVSAPGPVTWAINEMLHCANPAAAFFYSMGPAMANALYVEGTEQQKRWAAMALERGWAATMVLTEADAGSDVGAGRTKAIAQPDGSWHIEGVKRFISGGDVGDTAENIFHLVLARPQGAGPGTKGLSLFYVPKYLFDPETFELGSRNGVFATGLEHKMGLKASPTCELTFGAHGRARGWLSCRRRAQRDRADVHRHRARTDDGWRQGRRHAVHRLSQRAGIRQAAGAGRGSDPDDRQDRAAGHDHAPPGCAPQPDHAEGLRRRFASALPVCRGTSG